MLTWQFCLSGTHQLTHRKKLKAVGLAFITVQVKPKASTCHWKVCAMQCCCYSLLRWCSTAVGVPQNSAPKAVPGAPTRSMAGETWQEHQWYHQLEWLLWLWAGEDFAFFEICRSWIFQYWHNIYHSHKVLCYLINWSDLCCQKKVH